MGLEPTTFWLPAKRSSQLSYIPKEGGKYRINKLQKSNSNTKIKLKLQLQKSNFMLEIVKGVSQVKDSFGF